MYWVVVVVSRAYSFPSRPTATIVYEAGGFPARFTGAHETASETCALPVTRRVGAGNVTGGGSTVAWCQPRAASCARLPLYRLVSHLPQPGQFVMFAPVFPSVDCHRVCPTAGGVFWYAAIHVCRAEEKILVSPWAVTNDT